MVEKKIHWNAHLSRTSKNGLFWQSCQPYQAQTKGKVERPFHTIQEQFLRGLKVSDLQEFQARLFAFTFRKRLSRRKRQFR